MIKNHRGSLVACRGEYCFLFALVLFHRRPERGIRKQRAPPCHLSLELKGFILRVFSSAKDVWWLGLDRTSWIQLVCFFFRTMWTEVHEISPFHPFRVGVLNTSHWGIHTMWDGFESKGCFSFSHRRLVRMLLPLFWSDDSAFQRTRRWLTFLEKVRWYWTTPHVLKRKRRLWGYLHTHFRH